MDAGKVLISAAKPSYSLSYSPALNFVEILQPSSPFNPSDAAYLCSKLATMPSNFRF
jgi:hypothetical protein